MQYEVAMLATIIEFVEKQLYCEKRLWSQIGYGI